MYDGTDRSHIASSRASNSNKPFLIGCRHYGPGRETYEAHMQVLGLWGEPEICHFLQRPAPAAPATTAVSDSASNNTGQTLHYSLTTNSYTPNSLSSGILESRIYSIPSSSWPMIGPGRVSVANCSPPMLVKVAKCSEALSSPTRS